ncbi:hypothetical protein C8R43DRAFT_984083 [Mycena crocata]|nr:hypothetical protein C8R43DRAFT_984083 [Mycena crocata]
MVDLLRYRNEHVALGPWDGRVGAVINVEGADCFVTSHAHYIPTLPTSSGKLSIRTDMRFGPDDPTLWPHIFSHEFCHFGAIPRKSHADALMWWNPQHSDFVCPQSGKTLTRGLGKLSQERFSALASLVHKALGRYKSYTESISPPAKIMPWLNGYVQSLRLGLDRLQSLPSTYSRMVLGVTTLQRSYLELTAFLDYMTVYKPRMENPNTAIEGPPDERLGVFTSDGEIAQKLYLAKLPYWFIRPLALFTEGTNILRIVVPTESTRSFELEAAPGYPPVDVGPKFEDRMYALHLCTRNAPWYRDPVQAQTVVAPRSNTPAIAGPSRAPKRQNSHPSPCEIFLCRGISDLLTARRFQEAGKVETNGTQERDKYKVVISPQMAPAIASWAQALARVDRSRPPTHVALHAGSLPQQLYVMPEPALLVYSPDPARSQMFLHHYQLLHDALLYRFSDMDHPYKSLTVQEWRDVLRGLLTAQGKSGSKVETRTTSIEQLLGPALRACNIDALDGFPAQDIPFTPPHQAREITWEAAEINFRFEMVSLDHHACGIKRLEQCLDCFPVATLIAQLSESKLGFAADTPQERLPHLLRLAFLMRNWKINPCPNVITEAHEHKEWSQHDMTVLEEKVTEYYTQCYYEFFGRAATVPLRLEHEIVE